MSKGDNAQAIRNKVKVLRLLRDEECKTDIDIFYKIAPISLNERVGGIFIYPNERGKIFDDIEKQLRGYSKTGYIILHIDEKNVFHVTLTDKAREWLKSFRTNPEELKLDIGKAVALEKQARFKKSISRNDGLSGIKPPKTIIDESHEDDIPDDF